MQRCAREISIPASVRAQKELEHWYCLTWKKGHSVKPHAFWDSDIYKIVEAACYSLQKHSDAAMSDMVEEAVSMIEQAQHCDGYINSYFTVRGIQDRWTNTRDLHELYCLGHLLEATVAYEKLTRNGRLLKVAMAALEHVDSVFGAEDGKKPGYPGHQEIEIGLLRLYELTHDSLPLKLARYFILQRGRRDERNEIYWDHEARARRADPYDDLGSEHKGWYHGPRDYGYQQADCTLIEATEIKGHAVRALYYYTAAADLVRILPKPDDTAVKLEDALTRLWRDMVDKKMYITGGVGSVRQWEGFGPAYSLNDLEVDGCYSETCAAFALIQWCQRMLRLQLNAEYADVMETSLYNAFLGAVGSEGDAFYYQNVLRTVAGHGKRAEQVVWGGMLSAERCKVARVYGIPHLLYKSRGEPDCHSPFHRKRSHHAGNEYHSHTKDRHAMVRGKLRSRFRVPRHSPSAFLVGLKDRYLCSTPGTMKEGYLYIPSVTNCEITLELPMAPRAIYAHPKTGKDELCIARGPLVYCFEDVDNQSMDIDNMLLTEELQDGPRKQIGSFRSVISVTAQARRLAVADTSSLYTSTPMDIRERAPRSHCDTLFCTSQQGAGMGP